jgi:hypothetical protein
VIFGDGNAQGNGDGTFAAPTDLAYDDAGQLFARRSERRRKVDVVSGISVGPSGVLVRTTPRRPAGRSFAAGGLSSTAIRGDAVAADVNGDGKSISCLRQRRPAEHRQRPQTGQAVCRRHDLATTLRTRTSLGHRRDRRRQSRRHHQLYVRFRRPVNNGDGTFRRSARRRRVQ